MKLYNTFLAKTTLKVTSRNESKKKSVFRYICSYVFLSWVFKLYRKGKNTKLNEDDLVEPMIQYDSGKLGDKLERYWLESIKRAKSSNRLPSLQQTIWRVFWVDSIPSGMCTLILNLSRVASSLVFRYLLKYWTIDSKITQETAIFYSVLMLFLVFIASACQHHNTFSTNNFGMKIRVACTSLLYRKLLRMNQSSLSEVAAGKLVNLMSTDVAKFENAFLYIHYIWAVPIQVVIVLWLLYEIAGFAPIAGLMIMLIMLTPTQILLTKLTSLVKTRSARQTDVRVKLMNELVNGIQVIKMYAWEKPFRKIVNMTRLSEIKYLKKAIYVNYSLISFLQYADRLALFFTVVILYFTGSLATATMVFPIQQYFTMFQQNLTLILPLSISFYVDLVVSIKRIQDFLLLDENYEESNDLSKNENIITIPPNHGFKIIEKISNNNSTTDSTIAVNLQNVSASWNPLPNHEVLININLEIKRGELFSIIGPVGSGKSSLLYMLIKELKNSEGSIKVNGTISYSSQEAWLFSESVQENILFGSPYIQTKYNKVCEVCCLIPDFNQFPQGDQTMVGERGITLSGGQRARINLARAIYKEADIYLLDDPLSAVDTNVAKILFDKCVNGYLKDKTRILVTHQIHFMKGAGRTVVLKEGKIIARGDYEDIMKSASDIVCPEPQKEEIPIETEKKSSEIVLTKKQSNDLDAPKSVEVQNIKLNTKEVAEEEYRAEGNLKWSVFSNYFGAVGNYFIVILAFGAMLLTQIVGNISDLLFSFWTTEVDKYNAKFPNRLNITVPAIDETLYDLTVGTYFWTFGGIFIFMIILSYLRMVPYVSMVSRASTNIHDQMFTSLTKAKMSFFDQSNSGRILNRFTKDICLIDDYMPRCLLYSWQMYLQTIGVLLINASSLAWSLIPTAVLAFIFVYVFQYVLPTVIATKRLEGTIPSTAKSPVLAKINSTFSGISTIRCHGSENNLIHEFDNVQNSHSIAAYNCNGSTVALSMYLDYFCVVYLLVILCTFLSVDFGVSQVGFIGLALSQTLILTQKLQVAAKFTSEYLGQMTSVERVLEYTRLPIEDDVDIDSSLATSDWPNKGDVTFHRLSLSYNNNRVLTDISFKIQSGWKIGVVGRTGAGKTSLISALFRLYDTEGTITIDGIDTSSVTKEVLRSKISIIPQEPVLFSATLRYNLDPFSAYSDEALWRALEQVELKDIATSLDYNVSEGGSNFSVGQRQLICLARAVLRSNKILVMDEATANVDPQTDSLIQRTIREQFADCTVITIAHRLNTIMDTDRVLVLDQGKLIEYDHPFLLLTDKETLFYDLVQKTGTSMAKNLLNIAKHSYFQNDV